MVRILRLDRLRPGDLILETGIVAIAAATGGRFGHASVALSGLVKIEAENAHSGVVFNPFDFEAWHQGGARVVGVPIGTGDMLVLRKPDLHIGTIDGEALWEAGRQYSVKKLLELPDLDARMKELLERKIRRQAEAYPDDAEGRFCSEVAARILRLPNPVVSPNALAHAAGLEPVPEAIETLDDGWDLEPVDTAKAALATAVSHIRMGLAEIAINEAYESAAAVKAGTVSRREAAARLEEYLGAELHHAVRLLQSLRELEPTILHTSRSFI